MFPFLPRSIKVDSLQFKAQLKRICSESFYTDNSATCAAAVVHFERPLIMGVVNATPDSFSDGGRYTDVTKALSHARELISVGADLIDIGGESSRPNAKVVSEQEELDRVIPLISALRRESTCCISVDTAKPAVMREAIAAGADMINDIKGLQSEDALCVAAELDVPVCLMHMQGTPQTMQEAPCYETSVVDVVNQFFEKQIQRCLAAGLKREHLILDPGFGFGKTVAHNLSLLKHLEQFKIHRLPLLLGVSRKSTLGAVVNKPVNERLIAGITVAILASLQGAAIIRTHDVDETKQALLMMGAISDASD